MSRFFAICDGSITTVFSPAPCHHRHRVLTGTVSSPAPCHHRHRVITGTVALHDLNEAGDHSVAGGR